MVRKPTVKDKAFGCFVFMKDLIIGVFTFDASRVKFDWFMFKETLRGNFEVKSPERGVE